MLKLTNEQELLLYIARNLLNYKSLDLDQELLNKIDWEEFLHLANRQNIFPLAYKSIYKYIPDAYKAYYENKYYSLLKKNLLNIKELERIVKFARGKKIDIVLVKGLALSKIIYNNLSLRQYGDVDILVHEKDMDVMADYMESINFFQQYGYDYAAKKYKKLPRGMFLIRNTFHEYQYAKVLDDYTRMAFEIKRNTSAIPLKHIDSFLKETVAIKIGNMELKTPNLKYTLLNLLANAYVNCEEPYGVNTVTILRDYVDLYAFINRYKDEINWHELCEMCQRLEMLHKVNISLKNLNEIYNGFIAAEIMELFNPKSATYDLFSDEEQVLINWKSSLINRLFNKEDRLTEFRQSYKSICYGEENVNYNHPIILRAYNEIDIVALSSYIDFYDNKSSMNMRFLPCYSEGQLHMLFCLDKEVFEQFSRYKIDISFFDNNEHSEVMAQVMSIVAEEGNIIYKYKNEKGINRVFNVNDKVIIDSNVDFNSLGIDLIKSNNRICYNITLHENIYDDYYQNIGLKYENVRKSGVIQIPAI